MSEVVERSGQVVGFAHGLAHIRLEREAGCSGCGSRGACVSVGAAQQVIHLALPEHTQLGDQVTVSMAASSVAVAALIGYLVPPVCLLLGALAAASRYAGDLAAVLGAGLGLLAGVLLARLIAHFTLGRGPSSSVCHPGLQPDSPSGERP